MEASSVVSTGAGYGRRRKGGAGTPELDELSEQSGFLFDDESEIDDQTPVEEEETQIMPVLSVEDELDALNPPGKRTPARPRCVVLVPTRELAHQVTTQARRLCLFTGLKVALLHGGQSGETSAGTTRARAGHPRRHPGTAADVRQGRAVLGLDTCRRISGGRGGPDAGHGIRAADARDLSRRVRGSAPEVPGSIPGWTD